MFAKKLLQIDSCLVTGSTGHITESVANLAQHHGWECYIVHGGRYVKHPSCMKSIQSVSVFGEYMHYTESLLCDNHGLASCRATKDVVNAIKTIQPDIIQLHCLHGYYLNYEILFKYLNLTDIPVVWTFHDCWAFTGHCAHFVTAGCEKWKTGCGECPLKGAYPKSLVDRSKRNFALKKELFSSNMNLHIVPVSTWMAKVVAESFLHDKSMTIIKNGININAFRPLAFKGIEKKRVLGVSSVWHKDKGLYDFFKLRNILSIEEYEIILVGLNLKQLKELPMGILGIKRTESVQELALLYSSANVFVNPTYADTFPTVNLEAIACGTPVVTYRTGGSPEAISPDTGVVVEQGDVSAMANAIKTICDRGKEFYSAVCRKQAEEQFDENKCYESYIELYERLISENGKSSKMD